MKGKIYLMILSIVTLLFACKSNTSVKPTTDTTIKSQAIKVESEEVPVVKKYQIKSGIISFETDMMGIKQKSILYFEDYGSKEAEEEFEGESVKKINLCDGKNMYTIIPEDKTAYSNGTCYRGVAYRFAWDEISTEDQNTRAKILSNINVAGKDCESFSYDLGSSFAIYAGWKNICLYQKTKASSMEVVKKAVKVEENINIPAAKFQVPIGYIVKESAL